jgi:LPPG:FO 2-phospho-L-lactate transferase
MSLLPMAPPSLPSHRKILALCGGVGGAKLALGLSRVLPPEQLTLVVNTGDDFEHLGLPISPDLDTVMYTLGGVADPVQGWGRQDESWQCMAALKALGGPDWFRLGDRDLAVHLQRRALRDAGLSLSEITRTLSEHLGIRHPIVPMSDQPVSTVMETADGPLAFQHYFVRDQCRPVITGYHYAGLAQAQASAGFVQALQDEALAAIVVCPSNPFVSIGPILALPGAREAIRARALPVLVVSPIVGGRALKGPAAKMMAELQWPVNNQGVADFYADLIDTLVVDESDRAEPVRGPRRVHACRSVMVTLDDREALARQCLALLAG